MHRARAFFFVCAGIFLLALAYHLGAQSAGAQVTRSIAGVSAGECGQFCVVTTSGDTLTVNMTAHLRTFRGNLWKCSEAQPD
jgi:hypothetical protein